MNFNQTIKTILENNDAFDKSYKIIKDDAIIYIDANGDYHRIGEPAMIYKNGTKLWYYHGILHRTDGPAEIVRPSDTSSGYQAWWIHGKLHRTDGPAVVYNNGREMWYENGQRHREDGPACIDGNHREYYIRGKYLTEKEFEKFIKHKKFKEEIAAKKNSLFTKEFLDEF